MKVTVYPSKLSGVVSAIPSKSMAHRLLICAAMAEGVSRVYGISDCEDVRATLDCLNAMGVKTEESGDTVTVYGRSPLEYEPADILRCRESGSTLRFLIPAAMLSGRTAMLVGAESLMSRPMSVYKTICEERGLDFIEDKTSITVRGPLKAGVFSLPGNVSSQFISGLLFALPNLEGDSRIRIAPPIESRSYIEMTIEALATFGVRAIWEDEYTIFIGGAQRYRACEVTVEGDYSGAAFIEALNLFGGEVKIDGLSKDSLQGDRIYEKYFSMLKMGIPTIHIGDCPDLGPILMAVAAAKNGAVFTGTKRLKIKESDRGAAMAAELAKFGVSVTVHEDSIIVYPPDFHAPTETLCGHNDHRIVMALSTLLCLTGGEIEGAEAVRKSLPEYFELLRSLGAQLNFR